MFEVLGLYGFVEPYTLNIEPKILNPESFTVSSLS